MKADEKQNLEVIFLFVAHCIDLSDDAGKIMKAQYSGTDILRHVHRGTI